MVVKHSPFLLLLALTVRLSEQYCAPDCTGKETGDTVRDPSDCTRYFVCMKIGDISYPSDEPNSCPLDKYYSTVSHSCLDIAGAPADFCSNLCNPCELNCTPGYVEPDPLSCNHYYVCLAETSLRQQCSSMTPYFSYVTDECSSNINDCYRLCDKCVPHCTTFGEKVADPLDCTKFYYCEPPYEAHFSCPSGNYFDPIVEECVAGTMCTNIC